MLCMTKHRECLISSLLCSEVKWGGDGEGREHKHIKFKLVKKSTSYAILYTLILWIFKIFSKIRFPPIDLKLF